MAKRGIVIPLIILVVAALLFFVIDGKWTAWSGSRAEQETEDAYVQADMTPLSTRISGTVRQMKVEDFDSVKAGQVLVEIDAADYRAIVEEAKAALAASKAALEDNQAAKRIQETKIQNAEAMVAEAEAAVSTARAGIASTQPDVERTAIERKRQEALMASKATTQQQLESAVADAERCSGLLAGRQADLERAQAALASSRVQIEAQKRACLGSPCTPWILSKHHDFARSLVHGSLDMALDLLERRGTYTSHDGADSLWHPLAAVSKTRGGTTQTELARIFLREPRVCAALYSARAGAAAELDELRDDHCVGRYRTLSVAGGPRSTPETAKPDSPFEVPHAAKHNVARVDRRLLRFRNTRTGLFATKLSRIHQRLSPAANRAGDALGSPSPVHLRTTSNVSAEVHRRPADPDCRLHPHSDRLPDERGTFLSMVGRQLLAFAGGHVRWSSARLQRCGGRHHT